MAIASIGVSHGRHISRREPGRWPNPAPETWPTRRLTTVDEGNVIGLATSRCGIGSERLAPGAVSKSGRFCQAAEGHPEGLMWPTLSLRITSALICEQPAT